MKYFLNVDTLKGLAKKRHRPSDVMVGAGAVLVLWAFLYYVLGFEFNYQHVFEVLIGVLAPAWIVIRFSQRPDHGAARSVLPSAVRFAITGVAVAVIGIIAVLLGFEGSPRLLGPFAGILIGAIASLPGVVAVLFASDLVCYFRETNSKKR
jgi:hypothetical protein